MISVTPQQHLLLTEVKVAVFVGQVSIAKLGGLGILAPL